MMRLGAAQARRGASLLILLLAAGCMSDTPEYTPRPGALRFLALGDSYTIGEGVASADRWPVQLAQALWDEGTDLADPQTIATTGWTVAELDAGIDAEAPGGPFDVVTLLVGVNDQYRGGTAEAYRPEFRALLARAVGFAGGEAGHVVVLATPDWGVTPFAEGRDRAAIAREIDAFNAVAEQEAARLGARWVDVSAVSRRYGALETAPDGLHPSGALYARWAALARPEVWAALTE